MAFAQLTWRESLRDTEITLGANSNTLYAMGLRHELHRSTLADANDSRDWRMWSDLSALLIHRARKLYHDEDLRLDLTNTRADGRGGEFDRPRQAGYAAVSMLKIPERLVLDAKAVAAR